MRIADAYRPLLAAARKAGWTITSTGKGHLKWQPPAGRPVFTASSPNGSHRERQNARGKLRRAGLEV